MVGLAGWLLGQDIACQACCRCLTGWLFSVLSLSDWLVDKCVVVVGLVG